MKNIILLCLFGLLLFGCIEHETELEGWSAAGSTITPNENLEIFVTPSPTAQATASATAQATQQATVTPTQQASPSPSPSPAVGNSCTISAASGSTNLHKQIIVKFVEDTTAAVYCSGTASPQYLDLTLSGSGFYTGFADCYYTNTGSYAITASGADDTQCSKQITIESS
jgi:hypothetical protein